MSWFPHIALVLAFGLACGTLAGFEDFEGDAGASAGSPSTLDAGGGGAAGSRERRPPELSAGAGGREGAPSSGGAAPSRAGAANGGRGGKGGSGGTVSRGGAAAAPDNGGAASWPPEDGAGSLAGGAPNAAGLGGAGGEDVARCGTQLLRDGAFDARSDAWMIDPFVSLPVIVPASDSNLMAAGVTPHSGDHLAWLGGVPDTEASHYVTLEQWVTVPEETIRLVVSGQLWIRTAELPEGAYDRFVIQLMDGAENLLWLAKMGSNRNATEGWTAFESGQTELDAIRGATVLFRVESLTDAGTVTNFWVDSLRLEADCNR